MPHRPRPSLSVPSSPRNNGPTPLSSLDFRRLRDQVERLQHAEAATGVAFDLVQLARIVQECCVPEGAVISADSHRRSVSRFLKSLADALLKELTKQEEASPPNQVMRALLKVIHRHGASIEVLTEKLALLVDSGFPASTSPRAVLAGATQGGPRVRARSGPCS